MQVAALDAVARMPAEADLHQRVAGAARPLLALPFQADRLAVLKIGRQLDRHLPPVGEHGGDFWRGGGLLDGDVERHVDVVAGRRLAGTGAALRKTLAAEYLAEDVASAAGERIAAGAAELETRAAGTGLLAAETG